ncbi:hypothetical protein Tco_1504942 [Tanacetum coccineum]
MELWDDVLCSCLKCQLLQFVCSESLLQFISAGGVNGHSNSNSGYHDNTVQAAHTGTSSEWQPGSGSDRVFKNTTFPLPAPPSQNLTPATITTEQPEQIQPPKPPSPALSTTKSNQPENIEGNTEDSQEPQSTPPMELWDDVKSHNYLQGLEERDRARVLCFPMGGGDHATLEVYLLSEEDQAADIATLPKFDMPSHESSMTTNDVKSLAV